MTTRPRASRYHCLVGNPAKNGSGDGLEGPLFPQQRTFVLRFDRTADLAAGRWTGKLEEVANCGRHSFADVGELIAHLRKLMD